MANALTHRDYTRLGAVHVRWERDAVTVSNPGGFVEGVTLDNILTTEPRPRNPMLADAFKRVGLVERTGRGVDLMYRGLLRYGRPAPDFGRSTATQVVVRLSTADADLGFLEMILSAERGRGGLLPVDALIALSLLREERRADAARVAKAIQKDQLVGMGWKHTTGNLDHVSATGRESFRDVLLLDDLRKALRRINLDPDGAPWLDDDRITQAINVLGRLGTAKLLEANHKATELLLEGTVVDGVEGWEQGRGRTVHFIDWDHPDNNTFRAVNQFKVACDGGILHRPRHSRTSAEYRVHRDRVDAIDGTHRVATSDYGRSAPIGS